MLKILIVDDEPNILLSLEFLMQKNGFEVLIARNGKEALAAIEREMPQIVILDIMMPDLDGYAICKFIRNESKIQEAKVIFLTAKTRASDIERGYEVGADLYVNKPFSTRKLLEDVKAMAASINQK